MEDFNLLEDFDFFADQEEQTGVHFFTEDTDFQLDKEELIINWLNTVVAQENHKITTLNYIFCSDTYLHKINVEYLNHDTLTDIVTFHYSQTEGIVEGDLYISIDRVKENAKTLGTSFQNELNRVIIHGVLHICGYGDKTPAEKSIMRTKENEALALLNNE